MITQIASTLTCYQSWGAYMGQGDAERLTLCSEIEGSIVWGEWCPFGVVVPGEL